VAIIHTITECETAIAAIDAELDALALVPHRMTVGPDSYDVSSQVALLMNAAPSGSSVSSGNNGSGYVPRAEVV
jgi:hypothetical protein